MGDYSNLFVCLMGLCTVFIGLVCIIALVSAMSAVVRRTDTAPKEKKVGSLPQKIETDDRPTPELVAVIATAIAETIGTEPNALRIVSIKKV